MIQCSFTGVYSTVYTFAAMIMNCYYLLRHAVPHSNTFIIKQSAPRSPLVVRISKRSRRSISTSANIATATAANTTHITRTQKLQNALKRNQQDHIRYLCYGATFFLSFLGLNRCIRVVPAGSVAVVVTDNHAITILKPGLHFLPHRTTRTLSTRTQALTIRPRMWSDRGTKIFVTATVLFRLNPDAMDAFCSTSSNTTSSQNNQSNNSNLLLDPKSIVESRSRAVLHDIITRTDLNDIYIHKREGISKEICNQLQKEVSNMGFIIQDVMILDVELSYKINEKVRESALSSWKKVMDKKREDVQKVKDNGDDQIHRMIKTALGSKSVGGDKSNRPSKEQ